MRIIEWFDTFYRSTSDSHNVREGKAHKNVEFFRRNLT